MRPEGIGIVGPNGTVVEPDPVDPLTDESITSDWDVIVVTAVVLDPGAPRRASASSGTDQTPGPQGPPAGPSQGPGFRPHGERTMAPGEPVPLAMR